MNIARNRSIPAWLNLWRPFWRVAAPYWQSSEKWGAVVLLLLLFGLGLISAGLLVLVSLFLGEVTSALAAQERERIRLMKSSLISRPPRVGFPAIGNRIGCGDTTIPS
ncbi:hypothetical protein [Leptolyngbya sp. 7M]|uniref:hypothetical protein n=1 Tax=Leptolyngbya sp. 7M TaxID=2812896 RepID=UPI001B8CC6A3|nr:hypothetical protein [Leptolyngbya sp. 7M]QYO63293.1 hypothetical protein JVX88_25665 [Leptolyngbya sp. 7M]